MSIRVYVPCDSGALSVGAEKVADLIRIEAARRQADIQLVRNGSRGLYWLEPMVEVETPAGRGQGARVVETRTERSAHALFTSYLRENDVDDPALVALFDELYDEATVAS